MSTDHELEPTAGEPPAGTPADAASSPGADVSAGTSPTVPTAAAAAAMPRSTRILAMTAGGVVAAAAVFGGGVAFGTSLNSGASTAQQGQFSGTPPTGMTGGGPGGTTGTAPTGAPSGAPTDAAGGATGTG